MDGHERMLAAFLAGDLCPDEARRWDEHLLECEQCWRAVREDRVGRFAHARRRIDGDFHKLDFQLFADSAGHDGGSF